MEAVAPIAIRATGPPPLIVTVQLDPVARARFDRERLEHFPPGRTVIGAHVTLFHAVPAAVERMVRDDLAASSDRPPFELAVSGLMSLGRRVAYRLQSAELAAMHRQLQLHCWADLTAQDRQGSRPHLTVQNKASAEVAARAGAARSALRTVQRSGDRSSAGALRGWAVDRTCAVSLYRPALTPNQSGTTVVKQKGCPAGSTNTRHRSGAGWLSALTAPRASARSSAASRSVTASSRCSCLGVLPSGQLAGW